MSLRHRKLKRLRYYREKFGDDFDAPDVCWCGVKNPYYAPLPDCCEGHGYHQCFCGGDQCVCHNHGEVECFGCEDCQQNDFDDDDDGWSLDEMDDPNSPINQAFP